ncbi:hypothetical protein Taro_007774 [Colocasia esculenta]|uniref:Uncharacterized protein n=1 Tax=Colocasia esculenta TaxID=4460 RepID=A0A843TVX1_COLES|nr:hypothetical protein [Colocasia esculenta]
MGSETVVEGLPEISPIRTAALDDPDSDATPSDEAAVTTTTATREPEEVQDEEEKEEPSCATPKSADQHTLKPTFVCPQPPRKARPPKRKRSPPPQGFFPVPSDLSLVFVPLPPASKIKIIRVG